MDANMKNGLKGFRVDSHIKRKGGFSRKGEIFLTRREGRIGKQRNSERKKKEPENPKEKEP